MQSYKTASVIIARRWNPGAEKAGYNIPPTDIKRLDALNEQMLAIRKTVYDMEKDGSSHMSDGSGEKTYTSATSSRMIKIQMIRKKQEEILAGLINAENLQNVTAFGVEVSRSSQNNIGSDQGKRGIEGTIEAYRRTGMPVSDSDADELRAFEQELEGK